MYRWNSGSGRAKGLGFSSSSFLPARPAKTHQAPEVRMPSLSQMKVTDLFHRLVSKPGPPPCPSSF